MPRLSRLITATDPALRNQSLDALCAPLPLENLVEECADLDAFRRRSANLYERVRALFFLYALHRFHLPEKLEQLETRNPNPETSARVPFRGYQLLLQRRFEEAIDHFLAVQTAHGPSDAICSALATAYHRLAFQTLADQVRRSVRSVRGNQWMFRVGHPADQPLRLRPELLRRHAADGTYPILRERTPVRMDLTHSAWSDIFFLGMDFPEGAQVLNVSIDLGLHGQDHAPRPPVEAYLRVIEEPVLRLTSVDLGATADLAHLADVFDFAKDYLGLLKAAVIASGLVPPGIEGSGQSLAELLARVVGPGRGLEIASNVNNIPKGSRLAVSTNLLAALISVCMRATGQAASLAGPLQEPERRLVLARAILGEWLGGSGGGWQDSGGVWPGMKLITGVLAGEGDPESGISRGRLLPQHRILDHAEVSPETRLKLQESLVLVHGGMAQNVGPILEMVTEKYLLRSEAEWRGRQEALGLLEEMLQALRQGDVRAIGAVTTRNFQGPIQTIIPWASTFYTETLIERMRAEFRDDFWGFWMLGGMSGGGMGFIVAPEKKAEVQRRLQEIMSTAKAELEHALPFAMEPVVYDFAINEDGTFADLLEGGAALMPQGYYALIAPALLRQEQRALSPLRRAELDKFGAACRTRPELRGMVQTLFDALLPRGKTEASGSQTLEALLDQHGFDRIQHEQIRADLRDSRIGLAQNRLPASAVIEDVSETDVTDANTKMPVLRQLGLDALRNGEVAVVTLAAGAGSRWTQGAGVVKALHPFCKFAGRHRTFIETHLARSRRTSRLADHPLPHIFTTSYLTHEPTAQFLAREKNYGYEGPLFLSPGKSVGLRVIPAVRDLRFAWEEMPQQRLDEQQQKVRDSLRAALLQWARSAGEAADYTDNLPLQCLHPVGHWYEVPNLLRNGVLARLLDEWPQLKHLLMHNIDTLGADVDPGLLGLHIHSGAALTFEVITRRLEDRGGGLARVNGHVRLVEGLAMPREEAEFALSYYNSMTTWIDLDRLLAVFGLTRDCLANEEKVTSAIRALAAKMPTYITIKDVKKRWGHGQEDVYPAAQFEKLWGDMTALAEVDSRFVVVPRKRGQQLKDPAQLDGWLRDGSAVHVESLCDWGRLHWERWRPAGQSEVALAGGTPALPVVKSGSTRLWRPLPCSPMSKAAAAAPRAMPSKAKIFIRRLTSTLILWGVVLGALFSGNKVLSDVVFALVLVGLAVVGLLEFYGLVEKEGMVCFKRWGVLGGALLLVGTFLHLQGWLGGLHGPPLSVNDFEVLFLILFVLGLCVLQFLSRTNTRGILAISTTLFGLMYVPWLLNFIQKIYLFPGLGSDGKFYVLYFILVTKFSDSGAYAVGSLIGRHKMIPRISPGKTWEGFGGAIAVSTGASLLFASLAGTHLPGMTWLHATILGVLLSTAAVLGDLIESLFKREAGVKDSGNFFPGIGGILDLLDSLLFNAPLMYLYLRHLLMK